MNLLRGNTVTLKVGIKDQTRTLLTNLATCTEIRFMVKADKTDLDGAALISKLIADGITVDSPSTGYVRIPLSSADMSIAVGSYYMGIQLEYAGPIKQEVTLSDETFVVTQDMILA